MEMRGDVTMRDDDKRQLKIELLSQWKLEAESRNLWLSIEEAKSQNGAISAQ